MSHALLPLRRRFGGASRLTNRCGFPPFRGDSGPRGYAGLGAAYPRQRAQRHASRRLNAAAESAAEGGNSGAAGEEQQREAD
jgi:hypothetical protein